MKMACHYRQLDVYRNAIRGALEIFQLTKTFPSEEKYSMVDQIRRSSRSVCANIAEAWRKRRYRAAFIAKLSDAESEAAETQVWTELASRFGYLDHTKEASLDQTYHHIISQLVRMIETSDQWLIK